MAGSAIGGPACPHAGVGVLGNSATAHYHWDMNTTTQKRTACNRDCPDACGIVVTIQDGRAIRLQGDSEHPVTRGFLCHRTSRFLDRQYSSARLTQPLMRNGGELQPATWDTCLDRIAAKMLKLARNRELRRFCSIDVAVRWG